MIEDNKIEQMATAISNLCEKYGFDLRECEIDDIAEGLYNAGYRKVDDFEAEDERLREVIRQLNTDYNRAWERLKSDCREIGELKAENKQLKTECALLDDELRIARQDTIDVLNKVKEKLNNTPNGWAYTTYIDELLKEYE